MNFLSHIEAKRDGAALSSNTIRRIISDYTQGLIPDYQMSAFLMAVLFRGLTAGETRALTLAMRDSGDSLQFPPDPRPLVDKHSTGGVGDKVSLPLAPLLACLGFRVPMISGRGLGITGGTLDKLDSIPGFQTRLETRRVMEIVQSVGCIICGQTEQMVPADKGLYALRDVTGTVPSIPLIVASILSKKLAEGLDALVLDVKFGAAAFMADLDKARALAGAMVALGNDCGVTTRALITGMDVPLGRAAGNWLEVKESVACLDGEPSQDADGAGADLQQLVREFAAHLLLQTGKSASLEAARQCVMDCMSSGAPRRKWLEMVAAQGADVDAFERKLALDHTTPAVREIRAKERGFISRCDARIIGEVVRDLGGGRMAKDSAINYDVGIDRTAKPGEAVSANSVIARVHAATADAAENAAARIATAFVISPTSPASPPLIAEVVGADRLRT